MPENIGYITELTAWHFYQGHSLMWGNLFPPFKTHAWCKVSESKHIPNYLLANLEGQLHAQNKLEGGEFCS